MDQSTVELLADALLPETFPTVYIDLDALTATVDRPADPASGLSPELVELAAARCVLARRSTRTPEALHLVRNPRPGQAQPAGTNRFLRVLDDRGGPNPRT